MTAAIDAATLKAWLSEPAELALIDVRELGEFGWSHLFFAVPLPYSRFELGLPSLVPNRGVRMVLCDADGAAGGIAERAARRAKALGYRSVQVLAGGTAAWERAGYTLYAGVNVPSKTFGELIEHARHTPRVTAAELEAMRRAGENFVIVDGRPFAEYSKMSVPGGVCCPNGELALRIRDLAPDPRTKIVVNCAGRTRSIIGAQTLIDFGIENEVLALENGTQGWTLSGLKLEHGATLCHGQGIAGDPAELAAKAQCLADRHGARIVDAGEVQGWLADPARTTYLLDVRSPEDHAGAPVPGFSHAPGGQLIQATDQWVGVRGARLVLLDEEMVRAPVVAAWLRQLGHEASVLAGGAAAARRQVWPLLASTVATPAPQAVEPGEARAALEARRAQLIDVRSGMAYRAGHIAGATWSIRPRIAGSVADKSRTVMLAADEPAVAGLAALDLAEAGCRDVRLLPGGPQAWRAAGFAIVATSDEPSDAQCIDFLFFTHGRHEGNAEAARQYLAWEIGLIGQLDSQERGAFRI